MFSEAARYGGWPANHGLWQWGDELVVGFQVCWYKAATNDHAIDRPRNEGRMSAEIGQR